MSGFEMFAVAWLSIAATVYAWGAVMIVACRALDIKPEEAYFVGDEDPFGTWAILTFITVLLLPLATGILVYDSVQVRREVNR